MLGLSVKGAFRSEGEQASGILPLFVTRAIALCVNHYCHNLRLTDEKIKTPTRSDSPKFNPLVLVFS